MLDAKLNRLERYQADVGSAYLEELTGELIYFKAGKGFAPLGMEDHILILYKALYGLKNSGQCWHAHFSKTL